ncbi:hypothetical protein SDRG_03268 [Saprolegnia diclina VS20]|uniref:N-acetyltransferase domain-containing protein n=1 Tax=Saprolegnia diclina (strain VS20) TaxID=1156394 RepID=T0QYD3_SAPDV|nr:hypothetical protein SDRG_03268 [Saprolegnia diclina VS20]EQC39060.1 hypothetical protein SDRG_03268 [Saprolegnia diclina VS20]|eukprot:XP_008607121.1 hypothetical protein SDRG_03268 [Saprolegnia diclina VS20]
MVAAPGDGQASGIRSAAGRSASTNPATIPVLDTLDDDMDSMAVTLELATAADADALAAVHAAAFAHEPVTLLKSLSPAYNHYDQMLPAIQYWLRTPDATPIIKAVDAETKSLLGWVCWRLSATASIDGAIPEPTSQDYPQTPDGLGQFTSAHMSYWQRSLAPTLLPSPHRILISITIAPAHQRAGVGSALLAWGLRDNLPIWVHASEVGNPFFAKHGFTERARVTLHLDDWAQGASPPSTLSTWGTTTFRYMVYEPSSAQ